MASRRALLPLLLVAALTGACASRGLREPPPGDPIDQVAAHTLFRQAVALAHSGDLIRAEQYFAASIRRGADEGRVLPYLLDVCVASSRFRAAVGYAAPYLERHPDDWHLRYLVATILAGLGDGPAARREFERVIAQHENFAGAHYMLGTLLRDSQAAAADSHFRRYLELEPHGVHAEEVRAALTRTVQ